ncbi:MAG: hypothetical protein MR601_07350 [Erysipelotrichaceae bacterium]|nr:hypothetical protein [Erysipelotrichaceae bacterium]
MLHWIKKRNQYKQKLDDKQIDENLSKLEKDDYIAMFIAAFITFVPPILLILGIFYFVIYAFFNR